MIEDLNEILSKEERSDYVEGMIISNNERAFSDCVKDIEEMDCSYSGPIFTWSNKQEGGLIAKKLDRAMINSKFMSDFPIAHAEFLEPRLSDHCANAVVFRRPFMQKPGPFKFFNFLIKNKDFLQVVKDC